MRRIWRNADLQQSRSMNHTTEKAVARQDTYHLRTSLLKDFSAAVDYIGTLPFVDRNKIGVIGICGSGGFGDGCAG